MDRKTYMKELAFLLSDITTEEREEALDFYENYFDEAGIENESSVIQELGEPSRVAAMIKAGLKGNFDDHIEVGNQGFSNEDFSYHYEVSDVKEKDGEPIFSSWKEKWNNLESRDKFILILLFVLAVVPLSFPMLGLFTGFFGVGLAFAVPFSIFFFGFWIITFILYCIAIILIVIGVLQLFTIPATGLIYLGVGCICIGFAKIFGRIAHWFFKDFIPSLIDGISSIFNKIFNNRGETYENKI